MVSRARAMAERILKLRSAATLEQYNGPVLFDEGMPLGKCLRSGSPRD